MTRGSGAGGRGPGVGAAVAFVAIAIGAMAFGLPAWADDVHPEAVRHVTAVGESAANLSGAREFAIAAALRNALMQTVGVYVDATTIGENYQVVKNEILLKTSGFATLESVESSSVKNGILRVKVKAAISSRPLAQRLKALGLTQEWKVAVSVRGAGASAAGDAIAKQLTSAGFRVLRTGTAKGKSTPPSADIVVTGEASVDTLDSSTEGGVTFYRDRGRIEARAVYADTAEIIAAAEAEAEALNQSPSLAASNALSKAGAKVGARLAEDIMIAPAAMEPYVLVRLTNLKKLATATEFEKSLKYIAGVTRVKRERYSSGVLELSVYVKSELRDELPDNIEASGLGKRLGVRVEAWSKTFLLARVTKA